MIRSLYAAALMLSWFCSGKSQAGFLTTTFASNNGGSVGGAVYFDLNVFDALGITLTNLSVNTSAAIGTPITLDVFTRPGTFSGFTSSMAGWTLVSSGSGLSAGQNNPSIIDISDFVLGQGVTGVAIRANGFSHRYTNGTGGNQFYSNADLSLTAGAASNIPFTGTAFSPRVFNGTITYDANAVPAPATIFALPAGMFVLGLIRNRRRFYS